MMRLGKLWIGTNGGGLYPLYLDPAKDGSWTLGTPYPGAMNASFCVYSPRHDLHYIVDERADGSVGVHRLGPDAWTIVARVSTAGEFPCHLALNANQTRLAVANYASGSVSVFRLDGDGVPIAPAEIRTNSGSGPNAERQASPHAHWVGFDAQDRWLYSVDLGTDEICAFALDDDRMVPAAIAYDAPPGSGPRHLLLHPCLPDIAYLASELANTLTVLTGGKGTFSARQTLSTLPADYTGPSIVAHLAVNRACDRLYVSNRGHDSIVVFALDPTGAARLLQHAPTGAAYPRAFVLTRDEDQLIVAHEKDECVTILPVDTEGLLRPNIARIAVPGAAFVILA